MKTKKIALLFVISWVIFSCQHDEPLQKGTVQFTFSNMSADNSGGRKQLNQVPEGSSLVISVSKSNGDTVFTLRKMTLFNVGDKFFTQPIQLVEGGYAITDFIIVGPGGATLFLTPKQGSPLANMVRKTIPISFNVTADGLVNMEVDVLDVNQREPESFGYAGFPIKTPPGFSLSVFAVNENGEAVLTDANAYVLYQQDTVLRKELTASINVIYWNNDSTATYTLVIVKDGHAKYVKEFAPDGPNRAIGGQSLIVVLNPAATITWSAYLVTAPPAFSPNLFIAGIEGSNLRIDWGDGISANVELVDFHNSVNALYHKYAKAGKYFVSITGDLANVKQLYMRPYTATIHAISLASLHEIQYLNLSHLIFRKPTVDISKNTKLSTLIMTNDLGLSSLNISNNGMLTTLDIQQNQFSTGVVFDIVHDLYESVRTANRTGILSLKRYATGGEMEGPPSNPTVEELHALINYGWKVYPISNP